MIQIVKLVRQALDATGRQDLPLVEASLMLTPTGQLTDLVPIQDLGHYPRLLFNLDSFNITGPVREATFQFTLIYQETHAQDGSDIERIRQQAEAVLVSAYNWMATARNGYRNASFLASDTRYWTERERLVYYAAVITISGKPEIDVCCDGTGVQPTPPTQSFCSAVSACMQPTIQAIDNSLDNLAARRVGWICKGVIGGEDYWHNGALQSGTGAVFAIVADRQYHFLQLHGTDGYDENELVDVGFIKSSGTVGSVTVAAYEVDAAGVPTTVLGQTIYLNPGVIKLVAVLPPGTIRTPGTRLRVSIWGNAPFSVRGSSVVPGAQEVSQFNTLNPFVYEFRNQAYGTGIFPDGPLALTVSNTNTAPLIIGKLQ